MKILFIANERIPSEKANSINIVKMCSAFASFGDEVVLVVPNRKNSSKNDVFSSYQVPKNFSIQKIRVPHTLNFGKYGFLFSQLIFSLKIFFNARWKKNEWIIFTRDIYTSLFLAIRGYRVFHDLHGFPEGSHWFWKFVLKKMQGIICTNQWKANQVMEQYGISKKKVIVASNGFEPDIFERAKASEPMVLRQKLGLSVDKPIVLYSGHFYDWKGAHILADAASSIPEVQVVLLGGSESEAQAFTKKYGVCHNITIVGHQPYFQVPEYLCAADVLVLPNSLQSKNARLVAYSKHDTSPIKMFEYMASGRPIVASDLPSLREILNEDTAVFFQTDNPKDLGEKIQFLLKNSLHAKNISEKAQEQVKQFTWKNRAEKIKKFLELTISNEQ